MKLVVLRFSYPPYVLFQITDRIRYSIIIKMMLHLLDQGKEVTGHERSDVSGLRRAPASILNVDMLVFSNVTKKVKDTTCLIYSIWYENFMKCLEIMGRETLPDLKLYMKDGKFESRVIKRK